MANAARNPNQPASSKGDGINFEDALKKLGSIVEAMESEELPLEALLSKYEEGTRLSRICQNKLTEAELKIQQLEKSASGELALKPLASPRES